MELNELSYYVQSGLSSVWEMYLLKYNKKTLMYSLDKVELEQEYFSKILNEYLNYAIDKIKANEGLIPYTEGVLTKGYLSEISCEDERIKEAYTRFYEGILNAGTEVANKYNGYVLRSNSEDGREVILVNTTNPLVHLEELMMIPGGKEFSEPMFVRLSKRVDVVIANGSIYGDAAKIEAVFGLSSTARAICEANRTMVIESKVFNEASQAMLCNPRLLRSFGTVNPEALTQLKAQSESAKLFQKYADFDYMSDGSVAFLSANACKLTIKYLSGKIVERDGECFEATSLHPLPLLHS